LSAALAAVLRKQVLFACLFGALLAAYVLGGLTGLDNLLMASRFNLARSDASQSLVLIEIDSRSLEALDAWPWPRSHHAALVERLTAAGVLGIALNIDFSARSSAQEDGLLARALANAPGQVILPVFRQFSSRTEGQDQDQDQDRDQDQERVALKGPIPPLRENAVPGSVNVIADSDGVIRRHAMVEKWNGISVVSMAALLAGLSADDGDSFLVDYGIRADTIPVYSYADIYLGTMDLAPLAGKMVLIGASAAELGARFSVPVYGMVPGTLVHALAYESMVRERMLQRLPLAAVAAIGLVLGLAYFVLFGRGSWRRGAAILIAAIAVIYVAALAAQIWSPTQVDSGFWMLCLAAAYFAAMARGLDHQAYRIFVQGMAYQHRRDMMDAILDNNFHGIVITDGRGRVQFFNQAAEKIFSRERAEAIRRPFVQIVPWADTLLTAQDVGGEKNGETHATERDFIARDGAVIPLEVVVTESSLGIGKSPSERRKQSRKIRIYTFRNIAPRKRLEQAQKLALDEAISAGRSKAEFLAIMSHELRTPLNAIIGFSDILRNQIFGPIGNAQYLEYADDIYNSGTSLLTLINDILNVSRVEAGKFDIDESVIKIPDAVESCMKLLRNLALEKAVFMTAEFPADLPRLRADERLLKQMMVNILSNAVKFSETGGKINIRASIDAGGRFLIETTDNGIGMAAEDIPTILLPFQQADSSLVRKYEGSGLGLYLVSKFIALHGGDMEIESAKGEGLTVRLCFPPERVLARSENNSETAN
jgi:PAS domain S-box-containing protein